MEFVGKLKNSEPTCDNDTSLAMFRSLTEGKQGWVFFSSKVIGFEKALSLADTYTKTLSTLHTSTEVLPTSVPAHVLHYGDEIFELWGLLYSNGAIVYLEAPNPDYTPLLFVWIDQEMMDLLKVPYLDFDREGIHNVPADWTPGRDL